MTERRYNYLFKNMKTNELELKQTRNLFTKTTTISNVEVDNKFVCYFLEDFDRGLTNEMTIEETDKIKVKKETCIGYGTYEIDVTLSQRFGVWLPLLINTIGFGGIRQHKGNFAGDTEGCQLPGLTKGVDTVKNSTDAFYKLLEIYLIHLTLNSLIAKQLIELHKKGKEGSKEFGEIFTKNRVSGQKIYITITK